MSEYGQINETTIRWGLLQRIIKENDFKTIVEVGTWKGLGSTLAVIKSKNDDTVFISLESNLEFYNIAKNNLKEYSNNVNLIYGKLIDINEVQTFVDSVSLTTEQRMWLEHDINDFKNCPQVLDLIPKQIDLLILDGGEFSTYCEWNVLKDRVKYVILDDINVLKCQKIYKELTNNNQYILIDETSEGNGFCIFKKL